MPGLRPGWWLPYGFPVAPRGGRGFLMPIRVGEGIMHLEIDGRIVATATERAGGWWEVTHWPRFFDRNQAISWTDAGPEDVEIVDYH